MFQINSPYPQLSDFLFSPSSTGALAGGMAGQIAQHTSPGALGKQQPLNRGLSRGAFPQLAPQGQAAAMMAAAPVAQGLRDATANSQWQLGRQAASEQFAIPALASLVRGMDFNSDPNRFQQGGRLLMGALPLGALFGG